MPLPLAAVAIQGALGTGRALSVVKSIGRRVARASRRGATSGYVSDALNPKIALDVVKCDNIARILARRTFWKEVRRHLWSIRWPCPRQTGNTRRSIRILHYPQRGWRHSAYSPWSQGALGGGDVYCSADTVYSRYVPNMVQCIRPFERAVEEANEEAEITYATTFDNCVTLAIARAATRTRPA